MGRTLKYLVAIIPVILLCGCSVTKRVPPGSYLLTKNKIEEDRSVPRKERIRATEVEQYLLLEPNRKLLGTNLYIHLYNTASADTTKNNWINRTLRNWGDPPVLLDSMQVIKSADLMQKYIEYSGFHDSRVSFAVDTTRRRKAKVTYSIEQNEPYYIGDINYEFSDELLRQVVLQDSSATLLHSGNILDGNVLSAEKERITRNLRNNGFFDFKQSYIEYVSDLTDDPVKDIDVVFHQQVVDYTSQGEAVYDNSSVYRIAEIVVNPQYDPMQAAAGDEYYQRLDTMEYKGLYILYPRGGYPKVRAEVLRQVVNLYPNYIYDEQEVRRAQSNIMRLGNYRSADIIFEEIVTDGEMIVSFISDDEDGQPVGYTTEKYLKCHINCIPALRQSYKIELEGTTSSSFNAIRATVGYQNRNFFRGAELFEASFTGGYEFLRTPGKRGAFEIGGAVSVSFPRFLTPFRIDRYNNTVNPRTKVEVSVNTQNRSRYERTLSSATLGYSWSNRGRSTFTLRPIDLNLVKMGYLDEEWIKSYKSEYLENSYVDQFVAGISGSYIYNSQLGSSILGRKSFVVRFNWETAGNLLNLGTYLLSHKKDYEDGRHYRIFGIRYAQYVRVDGSISDRIVLGPKTNVAFRLYGGFGTAYGNAASLPFDRLFYAGGSNSMRGWQPRRLGPGNQEIEDDVYPNQLGDMKLEANLELRFPVWKLLHGAVFFDLGNIWYHKQSGVPEDAVFKLNRFYKQLGFNTGLGLRFDVNVAVIRFDLGYKLHNPNLPSGKRWTDRFRIGDTVINFGVGYPF
ncbi:MAG: sorting and assembly machinery component 50 [Alistipes sp.]|nr:sorting and assembly machinery component 50 [Alistipes sp.]